MPNLFRNSWKAVRNSREEDKKSLKNVRKIIVKSLKVFHKPSENISEGARVKKYSERFLRSLKKLAFFAAVVLTGKHLNPTGPGFFLGAWARGGGGRRVPAAQSWY